MSTIGSDPRLSSLDPSLGRVSLDDLRQRPDLAQEQDGLAGLPADGTQAEFASLDTTDAGEAVLLADAWNGMSSGQRLLAGDYGFEHQLGALDLSAAADSGAEAVMAALA